MINNITDSIEVSKLEKTLRRGRMLTFDQLQRAEKILSTADENESKRWKKMTSCQADIVRAKLKNGGRPPQTIINWMKEIDSNAVTSWETERKSHHHATSSADRVAAHVAKRSEIGDLPAWDDAETIARIKADPVAACWHYFPMWFTREPSELTRAVIRSIWEVMLHGGNQSIGVHRGGGKSTITKALLILAGLCGMVHYAVCFGASAPAAKQIRRDIVRQLETNDRLLADFPAACIPMRILGGRSQRAAGQTYKGERTYVRYEGDIFQLAQIPGAASSGFMLKCTGVESGFLGLIDNGVRPDFVLGDDIQSLDVAASDDMVATLEDSVRQGFQALGGKDNPIRIIILATCTRENDFSDRILNPEIYPEYSGLRPGLVKNWGTGLDLWERYIELWKQDQRDGDKRFKTATAFYVANREAMDAGVEVTDPEFYVRGVELSTIQAAWHARINMTDAGYFSQIENRPLSPRTTLYDLNPPLVARSLNRLRRREAPAWANGVFAMSDVGNDKLSWVVVAFGSRMRAAVLDYGFFPERGIIVPKNSASQITMDCLWRAMGDLCSIWASGLWMRGNTPLRIISAGFDRGYEAEAVQQFCTAKSTSFPFPIIPMRGNGSNQWKPYNRNTIRTGWNTQMVRTVDGYAPGEFVNVRTDFWKEVVQRAWLCDSPEAPGACSLWGTDSRSHAEFADHQCGEYLADKGKGAAGTDWWKFVPRPGSKNHLLDAMVGAYAQAGLFGMIRPDDDSAVDQSGEAPQVEAQSRRQSEAQKVAPRRTARMAIED